MPVWPMLTRQVMTWHLMTWHLRRPQAVVGLPGSSAFHVFDLDFALSKRVPSPPSVFSRPFDLYRQLRWPFDRPHDPVPL